ncbi:TPA: hypothetical protein R1X38_001194 [Campylobacter upsaliensis]|nr:hypothetical protein [Campylobacter upsaliensis]
MLWALFRWVLAVRTSFDTACALFGAAHELNECLAFLRYKLTPHERAF